MVTFIIMMLRRFDIIRSLIAVSFVLAYAFPAAAQGWPQSYAGAANRQELKGIAIDGAGSVYVTGMSYRNDKTRLDYATLKYSAAGQRQWLQIYSGPTDWIPEPRNNYDFMNCDIPVGVCCDSHSNVYVTGRSYDSDRKSPHTHSGATIKYDSDGRVLWIRRHPAVQFATAMAVDADGNIYITGDTFYYHHTGWFVMKYDTNGALKWINFTKSDFQPRVFAIASSGELWIAGITYPGEDWPQDISHKRLPTRLSSVIRVTLDSDGRRKGTIIADTRSGVFRNAAQLDTQGNLYCETLERDWKVRINKFDSSGLNLWTATVADFTYGPNHYSYDWSTVFAVDSHGNLYQPRMGPNYGNAVQRVELTVFGQDGTLKSSQTQTYTNPIGGFGICQVTFDNAGHVFVGGTAPYMSGFSDIFMILRFDAVEK